jgi:putative DNA primase/helicase
MDNINLFEAIRQSVGFAPAEINVQGLTRFPTSSRPSNRDGWVCTAPDGVVRFGCWRQGISGLWRGDTADHRQPARDDHAQRAALAEQEQQRQRQEQINRRTFDQAHSPTRQSPVGQYLVGRGLGKLTRSPKSLRMAALPYFDNGRDIGRFPVMLAAVTDPQGCMVALHRTYIDTDGNKAPVPQPKKLSRATGLLGGASIKLYEPTLIAGKLVLGVAEGVETALACYLGSGIPTWSCMNAGGVRKFVWPQGLQSLIVFADNDSSGVGQAAGQDLAGRAAAAGLEVRLLVPEKVGTDWLDAYTAGGAVA